MKMNNDNKPDDEDILTLFDDPSDFDKNSTSGSVAHPTPTINPGYSD